MPNVVSASQSINCEYQKADSVQMSWELIGNEKKIFAKEKTVELLNDLMYFKFVK